MPDQIDPAMGEVKQLVTKENFTQWTKDCGVKCIQKQYDEMAIAAVKNGRSLQEEMQSRGHKDFHNFSKSCPKFRLGSWPIEFAELGSGYVLYFQFLAFLMLIFLVHAGLQVPCMVVYAGSSNLVDWSWHEWTKAYSTDSSACDCVGNSSGYAVIFWLLPMVASGVWPGIEGTMSWLVRLAALLAIPLLLRLCVAGLVWFSIKDGLWTISRAINDFQPDVILAFSWGGGLALWLLAERRWRGPTLLLAPTVKAMACVACRALPRFPTPSALAPVHVFHAHHDGFCPESQVAVLSAAGCELHLCDDNHVLLRRQTVEEIHSCLKQLLSTLLHVVVYWWQLAAFMRLKMRWPDLPRLYTVPGGRPGAWLLCALKTGPWWLVLWW